MNANTTQTTTGTGSEYDSPSAGWKEVCDDLHVETTHEPAAPTEVADDDLAARELRLPRATVYLLPWEADGTDTRAGYVDPFSPTDPPVPVSIPTEDVETLVADAVSTRQVDVMATPAWANANVPDDWLTAAETGETPVMCR